VPIPADKKEQAIYHLILSEMHRLHALLLNLHTLDDPHTERGLREHFTQQQNLALGKLIEWKNRRPDLHQQANEDFRRQIRPDPIEPVNE